MMLWLRYVGYAEGVSYLVLLGLAMPLKYLYGQPLAVQVVGAAHGGLFVAYCAVLVLAAYRYRFPFSLTAKGFLASLVPFGPWWMDVQVRRWHNNKEAVSGQDPRG